MKSMTKKIKSLSKLSVILLVLLFSIFGFLFYRKYFFHSVSIRGAGNDLGQFSLTWVSDKHTSSKGIPDPNNPSILNVSPNENNIYDAYTNTNGGAQVTYQLIFNMGGSEDAPAGAIKLKLPKNMFYGRDNKPISGQIMDIPLVEYPEAAGTGFNYRFETDSATGEEYIILENFQTIPASYTFECSLTWILPIPSTVKDGFTKKIKGIATVDMNLDGETDMTSTSNEITMKYASHAKINSFSESYYTHKDSYSQKYVNVYSSWNNSWYDGIKPSNSDDYVYAIWYTSGSISYATQPYTTTVTSTPIDGLGGEVVGYCYYSNYKNENNCFAQSNSSKISKNSYIYPTITQPSSSTDSRSYAFVMVKYPKDTLNDGEIHTLKNQATMTLQGMDGAYDTKTATSSIEYQHIYVAPPTPPTPTTIEKTVPFNPSYAHSSSKYGASYIPGGINAIENDKDIFIGYSSSSSSYYNYSLSASSNHYDLTMRDGGSSTNSDDYGVNDWSLVEQDDSLYFGDNSYGYDLLSDGDYELTKFYVSSMSASDYVYETWSNYNSSTAVTTNYTGWRTKSVSSNSVPSLKIYYKKNGEWIYYCDVKFSSNSSYYFDYTLADGTEYKSVYYDYGTYNGKTGGVPLPEGAVGIKAIMTSKYYSMGFSLRFSGHLLPSEKVKDTVKDRNEVLLYNYDTSYVKDHNNNIYSSTCSYLSNTTYTPALIKTALLEKDQEEFGKEVYHFVYNSYSSYNGSYIYGNLDKYTRITKGSTFQDKWVKYTSEPGNRRVRAEYVGVAFERVSYNTLVLNSNEVREFNIINEQRIGTFYDLLPLGMTADKDSVSVQTLDTTSSSYYSVSGPSYLKNGIVIPTSVSQIDNWQGTGRTMMIVKAVLPDDVSENFVDKYSSPNGYILSGMVLKFNGYYDWDRIPDYGTTLTNSLAYKSGSGILSNGYPDDASSLSTSYVDKAYLSDLDQDGNEKAINDTVYAQRSASFNYNTASDSSFKKNVKVPGGEFSDGKEEDVIAMGGGYYNYRLRYVSQKNLTTKNLFMYDVLEDYNLDGVRSWKGSLISIDVNQPLSKGVQPVIYYSTRDRSEINMYTTGKATIDQELPVVIQDIENNDIWTTTPPEDLSKVTAIAIDLSKDSNGNPYTLLSEESLVVNVTMQAPVDDIKTLESSNAKACNVAWWSGITKQGEEPEHSNLSVFEWTELLITEPKINVEKATIIEEKEGYENSVRFGETYYYDLMVTNQNQNESLANVKVVDNIPDTLEIDYDNISFYIDGVGDKEHSTKLSDSSFVKLNYDGNNVAFFISQLLTNEKIHILIPVKVIKITDSVIDNKFTVLGFNNKLVNYDSNETEVKLIVGDLKIHKKVTGMFYDPNKEFNFTIKMNSLQKHNEEINKDTNSTDSSENDDGSDSSSTTGDNNDTSTTDTTQNDSSTTTDDGSDDSSTEVDQEERDELLNGVFGGVEFVDGIGKVSIKSNSDFILKNMPSGYYYEVVEDDYSKQGYETSSKNAEGTIEDSSTTDVEFINHFELENPPTKSNYFVIFVALVILFGGFYIWKVKKV